MWMPPLSMVCAPKKWLMALRECANRSRADETAQSVNAPDAYDARHSVTRGCTTLGWRGGPGHGDARPRECHSGINGLVDVARRGRVRLEDVPLRRGQRNV